MILFSVIFVSCVMFGNIGVLEYLSRENLKRPLRYTSGIRMPFGVAIVFSYFIAHEIGLKQGLSHALYHLLIMVGLGLLFGYLIRATYRMMQFYSVKRDDYSMSAYFRWRRPHMILERVANSNIDGDLLEMKVTLGVLFVGITVFLISLFVLYIPEQKISHDFAIADPIESCTIVISAGSEFYDGLPVDQHEVLFRSHSKITVDDVTVYPITDRRNVSLHYWRVDFSSLSEDSKKIVPIDGYAILKEWDVVVYRKDGEIIWP